MNGSIYPLPNYNKNEEYTVCYLQDNVIYPKSHKFRINLVCEYFTVIFKEVV